MKTKIKKLLMILMNKRVEEISEKNCKREKRGRERGGGGRFAKSWKDKSWLFVPLFSRLLALRVYLRKFKCLFVRNVLEDRYNKMRERDGGAIVCVYTYTYMLAKTSNTVYVRVITRARFNKIGQCRSYDCRDETVATTRELVRREMRRLRRAFSLSNCELRETGIAELLQIIAAKDNSVPTATIRRRTHVWLTRQFDLIFTHRRATRRAFSI